eukprot:725541-Pleurochrysis_carterae.AAC.1
MVGAVCDAVETPSEYVQACRCIDMPAARCRARRRDAIQNTDSYLCGVSRLRVQQRQAACAERLLCLGAAALRRGPSRREAHEGGRERERQQRA